MKPKTSTKNKPRDKFFKLMLLLVKTMKMLSIVYIVLFCLIPVTVWLANKSKPADRPQKFAEDFSINISRNIVYRLAPETGYTVRKYPSIGITYYNNEAAQTDDSPNITASNRLVYDGSIAISQDLRKEISFGDIVYIDKVNKFYIVEDVMNKRYTKRMDIFSFNKPLALKYGSFKSNVLVFNIHK